MSHFRCPSASGAFARTARDGPRMAARGYGILGTSELTMRPAPVLCSVLFCLASHALRCVAFLRCVAGRFLAFFRIHEAQRSAGVDGSAEAQARRPLECVVEAGELLFVPHGWWHCVLNLDDSVALTQNYVSPSNLKVRPLRNSHSSCRAQCSVVLSVAVPPSLTCRAIHDFACGMRMRRMSWISSSISLSRCQACVIALRRELSALSSCTVRS